jgi:hypothetical protein
MVLLFLATVAIKIPFRKIPRNRLGMVFVFPKKSAPFAEFSISWNSQLRGYELNGIPRIFFFKVN